MTSQTLPFLHWCWWNSISYGIKVLYCRCRCLMGRGVLHSSKCSVKCFRHHVKAEKWKPDMYAGNPWSSGSPRSKKPAMLQGLSLPGVLHLKTFSEKIFYNERSFSPWQQKRYISIQRKNSNNSSLWHYHHSTSNFPSTSVSFFSCLSTKYDVYLNLNYSLSIHSISRNADHLVSPPSLKRETMCTQNSMLVLFRMWHSGVDNACI